MADKPYTWSTRQRPDREWSFANFGIDLRLLRMTLLILVLAVVGAVTAAQFGVLSLPVGAVAIVTMIILVTGYRLWWWLMVGLLLGYMFLSKGFATIGFYPVYIGEVGLGLGALTLILVPFTNKLRLYIKPFLHWEMGVLFVLLLWSVAQTIPYVRQYQFDALRDAMMYGYAAFAFLIMLLIPRRTVEGFFHLYGRLVPVMVLWAPILFLLSRVVAFPITFPGAPNPIVFTKGSDLGVHLAGLGAYMLMQADQYYQQWVRWLVWAVWSFISVLLGAMGRGVMVALAATMGVVLALQPFRARWLRPLILGVVVICILVLTGWYSTFEIDLGLARSLSVEQLVENAVSIVGVGDNSAGHLEGTKQWRLNWWEKIIDYTINGPYFWFGKGYGINLADSDGFQTQIDNSLRSPHNGHLTFLARSGVPGFILWIIFNVGVCLRLLSQALRFKQNPTRARYAVWLIGYLVAFYVVIGFDVFLEGPMGGIWYWAVIGFIYVYFTDDQPEQKSQITSSIPALARG